FFFSSRRRHTRSKRDWSSDVCSSDLNICAKYRTSHLKDSALTSNVPQDTCGTCSATFVPEVGLEPTHLSILHFECNASTNSAIRAGHLVYFTRVVRIAKRYCVLW